MFYVYYTTAVFNELRFGEYKMKRGKWLRREVSLHGVVFGFLIFRISVNYYELIYDLMIHDIRTQPQFV